MTTAPAAAPVFQPAQHFPIPAALPQALSPVLAAGQARFRRLGLPGRRLESWRFTPLGTIVDAPFTVATSPARSASRELWTFGTAPRLVFVNGHLDAPSSSSGTLPQGVKVMDLHRAARQQPELVRGQLGGLVGDGDDSFAALNSAVLQNGAFIHIGSDCAADQAIHLVLLSSSTGQPTVSYPRNLVVLEPGASAELVVSHVHEGGAALSLPVVEIALGDGAQLQLTVITEESDSASLVCGWHVRQAAESRLAAQFVTMGAPLARHDINVQLAGAAAHCALDGLYLLRAEQVVDHHLRIEHSAPGATSDQRFHGILDDAARAVFNGSVVVARNAQQTDARQSNRNLLLSDRARVHSNPQLEIFADDVRCSHGSAIGRLDEEAIFYLRSRGLPKDEARAMLVRAFAAEAVAGISNPAVREHVDRLLAERLPMATARQEAS